MRTQGWRRSVVIWVVLVAASAGAGRAQSVAIPADGMRDYLADAFRRNKAMDLAYLAAAPDSMLRWAPTPGVRDFAQQIAHTTHNFFRPFRPGYVPADTAALYNDRAVLERELRGAYDWAIAHIESASDESLLRTVTVTEGLDARQWRVFQYWLDHAMWTRASVIPYLRLHGVVPPAVTFW